ncbi:MAG TPA: MarR family transcriptional regulator [Burkholderiaceae bacterium]|nr:MarR family transcriptional regulator [Burkholderiaceae bacterium]
MASSSRSEAATASADLETRASDDHHLALKLWLRLLACTTRLESEVRTRLRTEFDTTLPRFDLMAQLERAPAGLTMSELSRRLMVTGGNVTGITDMLEAEGLVARVDHPTDRRAYTVKLTAAGRRVFARMAAAHERWIVALLAGLDTGEQEQVYRLLARLKRHLQEFAQAPSKEAAR